MSLSFDIELGKVAYFGDHVIRFENGKCILNRGHYMSDGNGAEMFVNRIDIMELSPEMRSRIYAIAQELHLKEGQKEIQPT